VSSGSHARSSDGSLPLYARRWSRARTSAPLGLVLDADPVRDARHVVEVADDLDRVRDGRVVEALGAECVDVRLGDLGCAGRQLDGELAERSLARREVRLPEVVGGMFSRLVVCALST